MTGCDKITVPLRVIPIRESINSKNDMQIKTFIWKSWQIKTFAEE